VRKPSWADSRYETSYRSSTDAKRLGDRAKNKASPALLRKHFRALVLDSMSSMLPGQDQVCRNRLADDLTQVSACLSS